VGTPKVVIPKKTVPGSLTGAGFDVGDLYLCRFREFVDGLLRKFVENIIATVVFFVLTSH